MECKGLLKAYLAASHMAASSYNYEYSKTISVKMFFTVRMYNYFKQIGMGSSKVALISLKTCYRRRERTQPNSSVA